MENERLRIGIDIAEVLAELIQELNTFYNQNYGTGFKKEDYSSYDLEKTWGGDKASAVKIVNNFFETSFFENIKPVQYSQESISNLSQDYGLVAISSRPKFIQKKTEAWINKYFSNDIEKVICTGEYNLASSKISKLDVCFKEEVGFFIEDNLETAIQCAEKGIKSFLLDKPWNKNYVEYENITRVQNWKEILEKINGN